MIFINKFNCNYINQQMIVDLLSLIALFAFIAFFFKFLVIGHHQSAQPPNQSHLTKKKPQRPKQQQLNLKNKPQKSSFYKSNDANPFEAYYYLLNSGQMLIRQPCIQKRDESLSQNISNQQKRSESVNEVSQVSKIINHSQVQAQQKSEKIVDHSNSLLQQQKIEPSHQNLEEVQANRISKQKINGYDYISSNVFDENDPLLQQNNIDQADEKLSQKSIRTNKNEQLEEDNNEAQRQRQFLSYQQKCQVKDVISECQNYVADQIHQIHSNAQRIEITESPLHKNTKRLKAMKEHYRTIIKQLKNKLDEICLRHNQSIQQIDLSQTVTFSQAEGAYLQEYISGNLEVKVEEVTNLKNQLQLHQEILTNIIEEDSKLKDKVRILQQENKQLKTVLSSSQHKSQISQNQNDLIRQAQQPQPQLQPQALTIQEDYVKKQQLKRSRAVQSRIIQIYTSQIINSSPKSQILGSQILPSNSAMSMMSLVFQGALSIGLLGQCRFLNEISKKYTIGEIKKCLKQRVVDAQLIYNFAQGQFKNDPSIYYFVKGMKNVLFLMKLSNQKNIAIFVESIQSQNEKQNEILLQDGDNQRVLLLELSKKKGYSNCGYGSYQNNHIVFGESKLSLSEFAPFTIKNVSVQGNPLQIDDEAVSFLALYHLYFEVN